MKCPKCFSELITDYTSGVSGPMIRCEDKECGFSIGQDKFESIVSKKDSIPKYRPPSEEENLSDLNNLGMDEVEDDFSDSPFLDN